MKKIEKTLTAKWEILATAEFLEELGRTPTAKELRGIYQGEFVPAMQDGRTSRKQIWHVVIVTTAMADDGTTHTHEMEWSFNKPMLMSEVLNGAKHIKVENGNIKTRWKGVAETWMSTVDEELKGLTALSAWATATCTAQVSLVNPISKFNLQLNKLVGAAL